ncbi:histidine phosphatase family protein [Glaciecola petra]|uniref:Histidine phosphatase family protein n=1 Tax=Glaciecola petra TaxID=3075602 RepID=A0ABU2ZTX7_9ALTE|nr:histidine phosphatase family protein [Aestuariibacter sp. P117]MDT0594862.1 histidine phosphatase family protein [Aestuariibacter sp. P117]
MWIYLTRHAETHGNINRIVQTPDTPLTAHGIQQADALALAYSQLPIEQIVCSDYARTLSTATPLHKLTQCKLMLEPLLRERNFGDLRGQHYDQIKADFFAQDYHPPNGESYPQFVERVKLAWQTIIDLTDHTSNAEANSGIMVMTHGLVIRCILTEIIKISPDILLSTDIQNTSVCRINSQEYTDMPLLCDVSHLSAIQVQPFTKYAKPGAV